MRMLFQTEAYSQSNFMGLLLLNESVHRRAMNTESTCFPKMCSLLLIICFPRVSSTRKGNMTVLFIRVSLALNKVFGT